MSYYPSQNLPYRRPSDKPTTPPATAPPGGHAPTPSPTSLYYPRQEYQPSSAPPIPQAVQGHPYAYYPGYAYDYNNYPRQPSGSTAPAQSPILGERSPADFSPGYPYDPRQQRPAQQFYSQQQFYQWQGYNYPAPPPPQSAPPPPEQVIGKRSPEEKEQELPVDKKKRKKVALVVKKEEAPLDIPGPAMKSRLKPPRQAQSAWQMFFADELVRAKAEHADLPGKLNVAQIAKDAGTAYSNLDPERKAFYAAKVQAAKEQHTREYMAWQAALTPEDIRLENAFRAQQRRDGKSRKANIKDPNAPRKPLSAYFLFLKSIREDAELRAKVWGAEAETTKQSVLAAQRWRALTDVEKQPYLQRAEADKLHYDTTKRQYEDDAAARSRGETVPSRSVDVKPPNVEIPLSLKLALSPVAPDLEQLSGFDDILPDQEWGDLNNMMGEKDEKPDKESFSEFLTDP
ncbi:uncharacterized protein MKK02DRAFT_28906 [Dioszegia hungarica]|uniref:HMG box domain-containing protein n=1 Tax=Dioszegia hungarica TaxID=4972 RepID=A0AA38H597_9TREE|nr:uncharacterized protein MKK02DRAFT_28906 [Dioszegia hungarica]KAI9634255.1 hypothetical protein MKK02DRAFT_28906 [Dioszegia hungarica]